MRWPAQCGFGGGDVFCRTNLAYPQQVPDLNGRDRRKGCMGKVKGAPVMHCSLTATLALQDRIVPLSVEACKPALELCWGNRELVNNEICPRSGQRVRKDTSLSNRPQHISKFVIRKRADREHVVVRLPFLPGIVGELRYRSPVVLSWCFVSSKANLFTLACDPPWHSF